MIPSPDSPRANPQGWPPRDPTVRVWVETCAKGLADALEPFGLVGIWLHGSLAQRTWRWPKSDVDLLLVVERPLSADERRRVALRCADLSEASPAVGGLELSVVLLEHVRTGRFPMPFEVHYGDEHAEEIRAGQQDFAATRTDADLAAHVRSVRERGVSVVGPPAERVFAPVPDEVFRAAVDADLDWILADEHIIESPVYSVLNLCRGLWLVERPDAWSVPSKDEAGRWAESIVPPEHTAVVHEALVAYRDPRPIAATERQRAARPWDGAALRSFRDWISDRIRGFRGS